MSYILITDSSSDLPLAYAEQNNQYLQVLGMPIELDGQACTDDLGKTLTHDHFYQKLSEGIFPTTSQINTTTFMDCYNKLHAEGKSIIYAGLSNGLSGTMGNAILARSMFLEAHPNADITVVDTLSASAGLGALIVEAVERMKLGWSKADIQGWMEDNAIRTNHWFAIDDLSHLKKGGRIPAAIAFVGTALQVKPILTLAHDGKIKSYASVRGRQKSLKFIFERFEEFIGEPEKRVVMICHGHCEDDAMKLKLMIEEKYKPKMILVSELSATIATHVGPGMIAVAFVGRDVRLDC